MVTLPGNSFLVEIALNMWRVEFITPPGLTDSRPDGLHKHMAVDVCIVLAAWAAKQKTDEAIHTDLRLHKNNETERSANARAIKRAEGERRLAGKAISDTATISEAALLSQGPHRIDD